jgi:hypothetical protein
VDRATVVRAIRQPASAAIAGLIFGVILTVVLVLFHSAAPPEAARWAHWMDDPAQRSAVDTAMNLIPFAGIAFLWFIAVVREQLGSREDRFFETVFLGSGLLFVAMLFVAASVLKAVLTLSAAGVVLPPETLAFTWAFATTLLGSFGARMAAVFTVSVASTGMRMGSVPRWLAVAGYVTGLVLLLSPPLPKAAQFLFPLWVIAISLHILLAKGGRSASRE